MNKLIAAALIALSSTLALAQVPAKDMAEAEVRRVDKDSKKVTLKHGPIKNLDMPGMTMVFQVRDLPCSTKWPPATRSGSRPSSSKAPMW
jgi:Cu(I)/Ag(I) efflux system protein CusF